MTLNLNKTEKKQDQNDNGKRGEDSNSFNK